MPLEEVERRTLWLTVWHSDMFGRNDFLGEVMLPINTIPLDDPQPRWFSLQDRVSPYTNQYDSFSFHRSLCAEVENKSKFLLHMECLVLF